MDNHSSRPGDCGRYAARVVLQGPIAMAINTRRVANRTKLRFTCLDEMVSYATHLVNVGTNQLGNWSLGQNLQHLALIQNASIDGFPKMMPWPVRFLASALFKKRMLNRGFPPSGPNAPTLIPEPIDDHTGLNNLIDSTTRVTTETKRSAHPVFGYLQLDEWTLVYLRHAELHLSFSVPHVPFDETEIVRNPKGRITNG